MKKKISALIIFFLLFFASSMFSFVYGAKFSEGIFPSRIDMGLYGDNPYFYSLEKVESFEEKGFGKSYLAKYNAADDDDKIIFYPYSRFYVTISQIKDKKAVDNTISKVKENMSEGVGSVFSNPQWGETVEYQVAGHDATYFSYTLDDITPGDLIGGTKYYNGVILYTTVDQYFILVEFFYNFTTKNRDRRMHMKDTLNEAEVLLEKFIDVVEGKDLTVEEERFSFLKKLFSKEEKEEVDVEEEAEEKKNIFEIIAGWKDKLVGLFSKKEGLSEDMFPESLKGLKQTKVVDQAGDPGVEEGFKATYDDQAGDESIYLTTLRLESVELASEFMTELIPEKKKEFRAVSDVEPVWGGTKNTTVSGFKTKAINYTTKISGVYVYGGYIFTTIDDYFLSVHITVTLEDLKPGLSDLKDILGMMIDDLPEGVVDKAGKKKKVEEKVEEEEEIEVEKEEKEEKEEKVVKQEARCGDLLCSSTLGENCKDCPEDCLRFSGYCCDVKSQGFMYSNNYQKKRFSIIESGGAIPTGAISVPKEATEKNFFKKYTPMICEGGTMVAGECVENWNCYKGICLDHYCQETTSEEVKVVSPKKGARQIVDKQEATRKAYTQAYASVKDGVSTVTTEMEALEIKMFVQGDLVDDKILEVVEGNEVEVSLEIENVTDDLVAILPAISYPGFNTGAFDLKELDYTMTYESWYKGVFSWSSLIGSHLTHRKSGQVIIMYPDSIFKVVSKVVPLQTGYLDIEGVVYVSSAKRFVEIEPDLKRWNLMPKGDLIVIDQKEIIRRDTDEFNEIFDLSTGSSSVLVKEKTCYWAFCL